MPGCHRALSRIIAPPLGLRDIRASPIQACDLGWRRSARWAEQEVTPTASPAAEWRRRSGRCRPVRQQLLAWAGYAGINASVTPTVRQRVEELVAVGLKPLDAAHVAFAEAMHCDVLLTCDDRILQRVRRLNLSLRVLNPVEYVMEIGHG